MTLRQCQNLSTKEQISELKVGDYQTVEFAVDDFEDKTQTQKFKSDAEITRARAPGRRELQKYAPEAPVQHTLDEHSDLGKFDQFETNRKLFGVTATYSEDQYTTPLVRPEELTPDQIRHSEQVMKAIARNETLDDAGGEMDEEERYAAVKGTGRYKESKGGEVHPPLVTKINTKLERQGTEKTPSPCEKKEYIKLRDDLLTGKRITTSLVSDPTRIEALQLEVTPFRNDEIAANLESFKRKAPKEHADVTKELKTFISDFDRKSASRKNSVIDMKPKKADDSPVAIEVIDEPPASLLDLYLDSLSNLEAPLASVEPFWPVPVDHKALTVPPVKESPFLNPDAPEFEFVPQG